MKDWRHDYYERYYASKPGWQDGTAAYYAMIQRHVSPDAEVLELGCGPANPTSAWLASRFAAVDGLDIGPSCLRNHHLRTVKVYDGVRWPFEAASYDAVVCNFVLEHVEDPQALQRELSRVLRPGGVFLCRTPNRWHYVALASRLTPQAFHERVANRLRALEPDADDPYPTFYRMNSLGALRKQFSRAGFSVCELYTIEKEPSYGMAHPSMFLLFLLYERLVNSDPLFRPVRTAILGAFRKESGGAL